MYAYQTTVLFVLSVFVTGFDPNCTLEIDFKDFEPL